MREGARYQLYNMVFQGQKIKDMGIRVPALRAKMGGHTFYSFVMRPADLLEIAYVHHRVGESSFRNLTDSYQRMLKPSRIRQIKAFLEDEECPGFFPGNIIINFDQIPPGRFSPYERADQEAGRRRDSCDADIAGAIWERLDS